VAGKCDHPLCDPIGRIDARHREHRRPHRGESGRVREQLLDERRNRGDLGIGYDDSTASSLEVAGVERLVVGGRVRIGNENRGGTPAAASSQTVPPARETARSTAARRSPKCSVCAVST